MNGKRSGEAQDYLSRINVAVTDRRAFEEAVKVFNHKRYSDAAAGFQDLIQKGSPYAGEARSFLQKIDSAIKEESAAREQAKNKVAETGQDPKQVAKQFVEEAQAAITNEQYISAVEKLKAAEILEPGNRETESMLNQAQELKEEQPLRQGLEAYFDGRYNEAEQQLGAYVDNQGKKRALARFFRGAAHASRYFLSGEQDVQQKELALVDFRNLRKGFQPPKQYVSPKILSLYTQATSARPQ
jgi:TolA-binding protein